MELLSKQLDCIEVDDENEMRNAIVTKCCNIASTQVEEVLHLVVASNEVTGAVLYETGMLKERMQEDGTNVLMKAVELKSFKAQLWYIGYSRNEFKQEQFVAQVEQVIDKLKLDSVQLGELYTALGKYYRLKNNLDKSIKMLSTARELKDPNGCQELASLSSNVLRSQYLFEAGEMGKLFSFGSYQRFGQQVVPSSRMDSSKHYQMYLQLPEAKVLLNTPDKRYELKSAGAEGLRKLESIQVDVKKEFEEYNAFICALFEHAFADKMDSEE